MTQTRWSPGTATLDDRADAGWPTAWNLRRHTRWFKFFGKGTWAHHIECWCQR